MVSADSPLLGGTPRKSTFTTYRALLLLLPLLAVPALLGFSPLSLRQQDVSLAPAGIYASGCAQAEPIMPSMETFNTTKVWDVKDRIVQWHQGIIRIPTQIYDDIGEPGEDHRWDIFGELHTCESSPQDMV